MISNPRHGWCDFQIGSFSGTPSYMTDMPLDLLEAFIRYLRDGSAVCAFDEEGSEFLLVMDTYTMSILVIKEGHVYDVSGSRPMHEAAETLATELISDIREDLDGWQYFTTEADDPKSVKLYRETLRQKIAVLEKMLAGREEKAKEKVVI